jgi:hypothetical protein
LLRKGICVDYRWVRRIVFDHIVVVKWSWILAAMALRTRPAHALPEGRDRLVLAIFEDRWKALEAL